MFDATHASIQQQGALFDLRLLTYKVLNLLSEEVLLVHVHILELAEVTFKVHDVFHDLLQGLIIELHSLVLEGSQLTAKQLALLLVLIEILGELNNMCLVKFTYLLKLTYTF